jgi:hypothetical protein
MAYDPDMGGDTAPLLAAFNNGFAGHIRAEAEVVERFPPGSRPWLPRATVIFLLYPGEPESRCGVPDLLHPSEAKTPRCGNSICRCMTLTGDTPAGTADHRDNTPERSCGIPGGREDRV